MIGKIKRFWRSLGPGLITGAADNDPAGIATYSIVGAQFGLGQIWTLLYLLPFMITVQGMCARIGALTGCGLAANIKRHYPRWLLAIAAVSLLGANTFNIGADVYGMAGALNLVLPINVNILAIIMAVIMMVVVVFLRYRQIERIFKWFALSLFVYGIALILVNPHWGSVLAHLVIPRVQINHDFLLSLFAILGTTISPYMFFWQASEEAEETDQVHPRLRVCKYHVVSTEHLHHVQRDTRLGMIASNTVSFFVMALAASTIYNVTGGRIETLRDAAQALAPLAGPYAFGLFALGIVGSGFLAIPVLAGSGAYVVAELMGWPASLDRPFNRARQFYLVMIASVAIGMLLPWIGITALQALFWSAILNGLVAPLLIMLIIHMARNPDIVGTNTMSIPSYAIGLGALMLMLTGTIFVVIS